jgi:hypothetical protein
MIPFFCQKKFFPNSLTRPSLPSYSTTTAKYLASFPSSPFASPPHRYDITILGYIDDEVVE